MNIANRVIALTVLILIYSQSPAVVAQQNSGFEIGFRADGNLSNGEPANDILGASIIGRYRLDRNWIVGIAIETAEYDFEQPYKSIGMTSTEVIDSTASSLLLSIWAERRYNETSRNSYWFWTAGLGINSVDVDDINGITQEGQAFFYETDVDSEIVATVTAGRRHNLGDNWSLGYGIRLEHRRGDWTIFDRVSGDSVVAIDSYNVHGAFLSVNYRF